MDVTRALALTKEQHEREQKRASREHSLPTKIPGPEMTETRRQPMVRMNVVKKNAFRSSVGATRRKLGNPSGETGTP
jgi:hypothetical protein